MSLGMNMLLKSLIPQLGEARTLAIAALAGAFAPLQPHPHRLLQCREFWRALIEYLKGTRLGIPDIPRRPVKFVKSHNYQSGMTNKLITP